MDSIRIDNFVIVELYRFMSEYYNPEIADYVLGMTGIDKQLLLSFELTYELFCKILQYIHRMSKDKDICYKAGRFFEKNRLFSGIKISGVRFSLKRTYKKIDKILNSYFPDINFSISRMYKNNFVIEVESAEKSTNFDYFFSEYLRGVLSSIPNHWDIPSANVKIQTYPFGIEDMLGLIDVPCIKKYDTYLIYDKVIAIEKEVPGNPDDLTLDLNTIQVVPDDLFIKDIFIRKNTILNSDKLKIRVKWENVKVKKGFVFFLFILLGIGGAIYSFLQNPFPLRLLITAFLCYEAVVLLVFSALKNRKLKKLYWKIEAELSMELSEYKSAMDDAINNAFTRLKSIENIMEITKEIIHEKNIANLIDSIRRLTARALNADRATVFIHDKENNELTAGPELSEESKEIRFPDDKGIAGQILKIKEIINVKDAYNNPYFNKSVDKKTGYFTKTILGAPLLDLENNAVGVIQVLNKNDGEFQTIDEQILQTLSTYIAIALKDTLTIKKLQQRGLDPEIVSGLSRITKYIFDKYKTLTEVINRIEDPTIHIISPMIDDLFTILNKLRFLFAEKYEVTKNTMTVGKIIDNYNSFILNNKGIAVIKVENNINIPEDKEIIIDNDLLDMITNSILENSIEAIGNEGLIKIICYYYADLPTKVIHDLSIIDLLMDYNKYDQQNKTGFLDYVQSKKPFLESELKIIKEQLDEYIAFDFFDSGAWEKNVDSKRIFDPFFSTKNHFGLGLATAKVSARRLGGKIEGPFQKKDGKTIRVLIPLEESNAQ